MCKYIWLVKKDLSLPDSPDNWIVMNGQEFEQFLKTEDGINRKNNFVSMPPPSKDDPSEIWYFVEYCEKDQKAAARSSENRKHYVKTQEFDYPLEIISYSHMNEDGLEDDYEALMVDRDCFVEDDAMDNLIWQEVLIAIGRLNDFDREIIRCFYLNKQPEKEREYARRCDISQYAAHKRKVMAINNLREILQTQYLHSEKQPSASSENAQFSARISTKLNKIKYKK